MAYSGKVLALGRAELARIRAENEREQEYRRKLTAQKLPRLGQLGRRMRELVPETVLATLGQGQRSPDEIAAEGIALRDEQERLLCGAGWPADYLDDIYTCPLCRDSGYVRGRMCTCLERLCAKASEHLLEQSMHELHADFSEFDLTLYSGEPAGRSPRDMMGVVLDTARSWAEQFGSMDYSLLLRGGTGLGKTYLSGCIGRCVAAQGFSVVYAGTVEALDAFETKRFSRDEDASAAAQSRTEQYLGCDLLILDDLGTEMTTTFSQSALYTILNTRLLYGRRTVVSTNLSAKELRERYTPQICSRLEGEFHCLEFYGRDIRRVRKERACE